MAHTVLLNGDTELGGAFAVHTRQPERFSLSDPNKARPPLNLQPHSIDASNFRPHLLRGERVGQHDARFRHRRLSLCFKLILPLQHCTRVSPRFRLISAAAQSSLYCHHDGRLLLRSKQTVRATLISLRRRHRQETPDPSFMFVPRGVLV